MDKQIRLLVTGLGIGNIRDTDCGPCNYDYDWIVTRPSSLLWADKIIVTPKFDETIRGGNFPDRGGKIAKSLGVVFETLKEYDIIEYCNPRDVLSDAEIESVEQEIKTDADRLTHLFPRTIQKNKNEREGGSGYLNIENQEYCFPMIKSIYLSLQLARKWDAESLFSDHAFNYCKYKFGASQISKRNTPVNAFDKIFSTIMPDTSIFPTYVRNPQVDDSCEKSCSKCSKESTCSGGYLAEVENNITEYLALREHDEIDQIKAVLGTIVNQLDEHSSVTTAEIIEEFRKQQKIIERDLKKAFPKVKRWANLSLIASVPATVIGMATGLPYVSIMGATAVGASTAATKLVEYYESKYRWVAFFEGKSSSKINSR